MFRWLLALSPLVLVVAARADDTKDHSGKTYKQRYWQNESLNNANFEDATLDTNTFLTCALKKARFKDADLRATHFSGCSLTEADFTGVRSEGQVLQFRKCTMDKVKFGGANKAIGGLLLEECSAREADMRNIKFTSVDSRTDLSKADLRGANLLKAFTLDQTPKLKGALYDDDTALPDNFDPKKAGMILKPADDKKAEDDKDKKAGEDKDKTAGDDRN